ncbi:hypothetical protein PHJA_000289900 [Phtheirospermum japonicum]|uniref:Uncharacterized protein n=1 Tax=Phtheirospermum japonicum TaxID=374723 RepID=A0A830B3R3_9LAMI|nr:hypothetical protein PHJA_000289900 [Phtheirospermum japonicum]
MDNGIVKLTLTKPTGLISGVTYGGVKNVLEYRNKETKRGLHSTSFRIMAHSKDQIEVSFTITWNASLCENGFPLNIDKRFIMLRGNSGFYSYAIFEYKEGWPPLNIDEARIAFKLYQGMFHYMTISDDKQRIMPTENDREGGHTLDYREALNWKVLAIPNSKERLGPILLKSNVLDLIILF